MSQLNMRVNGQEVKVQVAPDTLLVDVLRNQLGWTGVKVGCGAGECGACTVLLNGLPVASCITPALKAQGAEVITIEGLARLPLQRGAAPAECELHPIQKAFLAEGAVQCGFCTPGLILASKALLDANPHPGDDDIRVALAGHLCRCTGYNSIIAAVHRAAAALRDGTDIALPPGDTADVIGTAVVRKDGVAKVTGQHNFGADDTQGVDTRNMLHAAAVFSAHPYAEVAAIDTACAKAMPGVAAVLTAADVPGRNLQGVIIPDQPVLVPVGGRVLCIGDMIALVIADSEGAARDATEHVQVLYHELPGVFSPHESLAPGAPILHAPRPGTEPTNVLYGTHVTKGDPDAALATADVIAEGTFRTPFVDHAYLEPEAGTAWVDTDGVVTVRMASQAVGIHRFVVAAVLGLPPEKVRLIHVPPGGSFGARNDLSLHSYLALAAYHTKRPVKMVLTRGESFRAHVKRHAMEHTLRLGATRDGKLVGLTCDILADTGAYASVAIPVLDQATLFATGPYDIPNVRIKGLSVYTNNLPAGAMRGFGIPQSAFAMESLIDELAVKLGLSPFELRRRNGFRPGSTTVTGQVLRESVPFLETVRRVEAAMTVAFADLPPPAPGHKRGWGIASSYKNYGLGLGLPEPAGVGIELTPAGRILVRVGGAELGQGSTTTLAQIAAQTLAVPYSLVDVLGCDTGATPDGGITSASRTTFMSGNAVLGAAKLFLEDLPDAEALTAASLAQLAAQLQAEGRRLAVQYTYQPPQTYGLDHAGGTECLNFVGFSYATQGAIVDVDPLSGEVYVRKMFAAHDIGRAIHPQGARGQIEGSCLMGLGYALSEELLLDHGRLATDTLAAVGIPNILAAPPIEVTLVEDPEPHGPFGAKGIAEAAAIPTAPAIVNGIYNAIGVRIRQLPATPDRIVAALTEHGGSSV
jgi:selenium-dependent xanthine dehydrogenase